MRTAKLLNPHQPASSTVAPMADDPETEVARIVGMPTSELVKALGGIPLIDLTYAELREKLDSVFSQDVSPKYFRD